MQNVWLKVWWPVTAGGARNCAIVNTSNSLVLAFVDWNLGSSEEMARSGR